VIVCGGSEQVKRVFDTRASFPAASKDWADAIAQAPSDTRSLKPELIEIDRTCAFLGKQTLAEAPSDTRSSPLIEIDRSCAFRKPTAHGLSFLSQELGPRCFAGPPGSDYGPRAVNSTAFPQS
jgi:hypothetical protein